MDEPETPGHLGADDVAYADSNKLTTIRLRVDQPLQGCKLEPYTVVVSKNVLTKHQSVNSSAKQTFKWYRSASKRVCCYAGCQGKQGFPGFKASSISSLIMPEAECLFCSTACIMGHWNDNKQRLVQLLRSADAAKASALGDDGTGVSAAAAAGAGAGPTANGHEAIVWEAVAKNKLYVPTERDVGHLLKVECTAQEDAVYVAQESCVTQIVLPIPPPPPKRVLHQTKLENRPHGLSRPIRICSYNILAEIYTSPKVYPYCAQWALSWNFRSRHILRELQNFDADIFCLQEVQADRFNEFFYAKMKNMGYEGLCVILVSLLCCVCACVWASLFDSALKDGVSE
jgi:CCR4-NOT transcription complex subunit 6